MYIHICIYCTYIYIYAYIKVCSWYDVRVFICPMTADFVSHGWNFCSCAQRVLWMALATVCGPMPSCASNIERNHAKDICLGQADMDDMVLWGDFNPVIGIWRFNPFMSFLEPTLIQWVFIAKFIHIAVCCIHASLCIYIYKYYVCTFIYSCVCMHINKYVCIHVHLEAWVKIGDWANAMFREFRLPTVGVSWRTVRNLRCA